MKKLYLSPELDFIELEAKDVICVSDVAPEKLEIDGARLDSVNHFEIMDLKK